MSLDDNFEIFFQNLLPDNMEDINNTVAAIGRKLSRTYYGDNKHDTSSTENGLDHMWVVGSVGRKTAVKGISDLDVIFDIPEDLYRRFDSYEGNGQSALLQNIKETLLEKYPRTTIRGDGQVVDIVFDKYTIEVVPGLQQADGSFLYPDTHDGGSWQVTDPLTEQRECENCNARSSGLYYDLCRSLRAWKNEQGFVFRGILIDSLVYDFLVHYVESSFSNRACRDYLSVFRSLYDFLRLQNPSTNNWRTVGTQQPIENDDDEFIEQANEAFEKLGEIDDATSGNVNAILAEVFGGDFSDGDHRAERANNFHSPAQRRLWNGSGSSEEFINQLVPVDIRYRVTIDCRVEQNGFRPFMLRKFLKDGKGRWLQHHKKLEFFISTDCPEPYDTWWKVRNVGREAERRNMIRGTILKTNEMKHRERTDFYGPHYVECYLIRNGICVAKNRIDVPIGAE